MENGNTPKFRADIGMRLVIDADSYGDVGRIMDTIREAIEGRLRDSHERASFDFTHFQTHPCKAARMEAIAYHNVEYAEPQAPPLLTQH